MRIPLLKNTLTSYLTLAMKLVEGIFVVRWMLALMGEEIYGLWGILWSLLSYTAIVDFGFGPTVKKYTANGLPERDLAAYNRIISTIFVVYWAMAVPIAVVGGLAAVRAAALFHIDPSDGAMVSTARTALVVFTAGIALKFPLTTYLNIVAGLQRLYIINVVDFIFRVMEFVGVFAIFFCSLQPVSAFHALVSLTIGLSVLMSLTVSVCAYRVLPGLRVTCGFSRACFREVFSFSGWVYFGSVARLVVNNCASLIVGMLAGLSVSGVFQVGRRFPQLMYQLTAPYQDNAAPIAARFAARGRFRALGPVLVGFMRWNALIATGLSALVFALSPELIRFFFGFDRPEAVCVSRLVTLTMWAQIVGESVPMSAFLLAGAHRFQILVSLAQSVATVALTVLALVLFPNSATAVAVAGLLTVAATVFFAWHPKLVSLTSCPWWNLVLRTFVLPLVCGTLAVVAARVAADRFSSDFARLAFGGIAGTLAYLPFGVMLLATPRERSRAVRKLKGVLS